MDKVRSCVCRKPSGKGWYVSMWWFSDGLKIRKNINLPSSITKKSDAIREKNRLHREKEDELAKCAGRHELLDACLDNTLSSLFNVKENTLYKYQCCLNVFTRYLEQLEEELYIEDISPIDFEMYFQYCAEFTGYKMSTLKTTKAFLHKYFDKLLVVYSLTRNNPVSLADLNKIQFQEIKKERKRLYFTDDEIVNFYKYLLQSTKYNKLAGVFKTCITLGIRRSECLGLIWDNIDTINKIIYIKHTRTKGYKGKIIDTDTVKARGSLRSFPLSDDLLLTFNNNRTDGDNHVFTDFNNKPWNPDICSKLFKKAIKDAGLPEHMTFKYTRSTCACKLLENNFSDSQIIGWLGHMDISTTRQYYMEDTMKLKKEMLNSLVIPM